MIQTPIITLELHSLKQSISHSLGAYHQQISGMVDEQIEEAIKSFDITQIVQESVHKAIEEAIRRHFQYGDGSRHIQEAVTESLNVMFNRKPAKKDDE